MIRSDVSPDADFEKYWMHPTDTNVTNLYLESNWSWLLSANYIDRPQVGRLAISIPLLFINITFT